MITFPFRSSTFSLNAEPVAIFGFFPQFWWSRRVPWFFLPPRNILRTTEKYVLELDAR